MLDGEVPYRDFVFQVGPAAIYVDAAFQAIFGSKLVASLYAAVALHALRVFAVFALARRLAGVAPAALLATFCAFDLTFGAAHHWSWSYAQLSLTLSVLCIASASRSAREGRWLVLAGLTAGLVVASRQATAVLVGGLFLAMTIAYATTRRRAQLRRMGGVWLGFLAAFVIVFGALAVAGALLPAVQQMFIEAPEKKGANTVRGVVDALSGGALVMPEMSWGPGLVRYLVLPVAATGLALRLVRARSDETVSAGSVGVLLIPCAVAGGLLLEYGQVELNDAIRTFFIAVTAVALVAPDRFQQWFGIEPLLGTLLVGLPLASDLAVEMSFPGRGWTDYASLLVGAVCLVLASSRVRDRTKVVLCGGFALCGLMHYGWFLQAQRNPFAVPGASDQPSGGARFTLDQSMFEGLRMSEARKRAIEWLQQQVPAGSGCFLYGTDSALYDVLDCTNPTRIDTTIPDFISIRDAVDALAILGRAPPAFILSQETSLGNVPLTSSNARWDLWKDLNQEAAVAMHDGLRALLVRYEDVGLVGDAVGPRLAGDLATTWDNLQSIRIYRRKW